MAVCGISGTSGLRRMSPCLCAVLCSCGSKRSLRGHHKRALPECSNVSVRWLADACGACEACYLKPSLASPASRANPPTLAICARLVCQACEACDTWVASMLGVIAIQYSSQVQLPLIWWRALACDLHGFRIPPRHGQERCWSLVCRVFIVRQGSITERLSSRPAPASENLCKDIAAAVDAQ